MRRNRYNGRFPQASKFQGVSPGEKRMNFKRITLTGLLALALAFALPLSAASTAVRNAADYAFGISPTVNPLVLDGGPYTTASTTFTVAVAYTTAADGNVFFPLAVGTPILFGGPSNQETVTPTAVSGCTSPVYDSCSFTVASVTKTHGKGDGIFSGTVGLQEAINFQSGLGGGSVTVGPDWALRGGTSAMLAASTLLPTTSIDDRRATPLSWWYLSPSSLTVLSVPTTLTSSTFHSDTSVAGTWTNSGSQAIHGCITYVTALGGESLCSGDYGPTNLTAAMAIDVTSPAAATGAVGYRIYIGQPAGSASGENLVPLTSSVCTLTTLESVFPACAIGSNAVVTAITLSTQAVIPAVSSAFPVTVQQFNFPPPAYGAPLAWGPFPQQTGSPWISSSSNGDAAIIQLPGGFFNQVGKTYQLCAYVFDTPVATAVPTYTWHLGTIYGKSPATLVSYAPLGTTTAVVNIVQSCTVLQTAVAGSSGTIEAHGSLIMTIQSTGQPYASDVPVTDITSSAASVGNLALPTTLSFNIAVGTAGMTNAQVRQVTLTPLN
jgi:hypothetical protein